MKRDLARISRPSKRETEKGIIVDGGPSLVRGCLRRGLADDGRMAFGPLILGRGSHYCGSMAR